MNGTRAVRPLALAAWSLPFAFGVLRLIVTRSDGRYLWTAIAGWAAFAGLHRVSAARKSGSPRAVALIASALVSVVVAMATARLTGARNVPAMLVVTVSFAACFAAGAWLSSRGRASNP